MEVHTLHDPEELLKWLEDVYDWIRSWRAAASQVPTLRHADMKNFAHAELSFRESWPAMLPFEREQAVDIVLCAFCSLHHHARSEQFAEVRWSAIASEIGYLGREPGPSYVSSTYGVQIERTAQRIARLFPPGAASAWCTTLSEQHLKSRLERLVADNDATVPILREELEALEKTISAGRPAPLPSADALLASAQVATQTPEDRFHIVGELLEALERLYSSKTTAIHGPEEEKRHAAQLVEEAVTTLKQATALQHFEGMSPHRQVEAIHTIRAEVFEACKHLALHSSLPAAEVPGSPRGGIIHRIFSALSNPKLQAVVNDPHRVGAQTSHSLAHISDRYARRYYGTTARAWAARVAAGGM